jgi:hypothetical protein
MLTCSVNLRPLTWHQSVEHYTGIKVEGRRFHANCTVERGSDLRLSNKMRLEELAVSLLIFETTRMQDRRAKLPKGVIGEFSFHDASPEMDAFLSGWFVLNIQSLEDAWNQVRQGGYSECTIGLEVGPIESPAGGWLWDVAKNPHLVIDAVTVSFERPAPTPTLAKPEQKKSSMAKRLGDVLYWAGCIIALAWVALVWSLWSKGPITAITDILFVFLPAVIAVLIGWACRYVLSGKVN